MRRARLEVPAQIDHYVPWGSKGLRVPERFSATVLDSRYPVRIEIAIEDGRALCIGIRRIEGRTRLRDGSAKGKWIDGGPPLTASFLRTLPLDRIIRELVDEAAVRLDRLFDPLSQRELEAWLPATGSIRGREDLRETRRGGRGIKLPDSDLRRAVSIYRKALRSGKPPTKAVADEMHISRSTAGRWIFEARKRHLMGPTDRGQAGEGKESS